MILATLVNYSFSAGCLAKTFTLNFVKSSSHYFFKYSTGQKKNLQKRKKNYFLSLLQILMKLQ